MAVYDPPGALCGGPDGLEAYRRIAGRVHRVLAPDGRLFVEIGPTQAQEVTEIFRTIGLEVGALGRDLAGRPRVVVAGRKLSAWNPGLRQKFTWKTAMFRLGSNLARRLFGHFALSSAGRLQRQRERILKNLDCKA